MNTDESICYGIGPSGRWVVCFAVLALLAPLCVPKPVRAEEYVPWRVKVMRQQADRAAEAIRGLVPGIEPGTAYVVGRASGCIEGDKVAPGTIAEKPYLQCRFRDKPGTARPNLPYPQAEWVFESVDVRPSAQGFPASNLRWTISVLLYPTKGFTDEAAKGQASLLTDSDAVWGSQGATPRLVPTRKAVIDEGVEAQAGTKTPMGFLGESVRGYFSKGNVMAIADWDFKYGAPGRALTSEESRQERVRTQTKGVDEMIRMLQKVYAALNANRVFRQEAPHYSIYGPLRELLHGKGYKQVPTSTAAGSLPAGSVIFWSQVTRDTRTPGRAPSKEEWMHSSVVLANNISLEMGQALVPGIDPEVARRNHKYASATFSTSVGPKPAKPLAEYKESLYEAGEIWVPPSNMTFDSNRAIAGWINVDRGLDETKATIDDKYGWNCFGFCLRVVEDCLR